MKPTTVPRGSFAARLRAARRRAGLTQVEAEEAIGLPKQSISLWEQNRRVPDGYKQRAVLRDLEGLAK